MKFHLSFFFLMTLTLFHSEHSQAKVEEFNFNYTKAGVVISDEHKNSFFMALSQVLVPEGMGASEVPQPFYVDEIFSTPDLKTSAFVKFGYEVSDKTLVNSVLKTSEGLLFHSHTKEGVPYALMFKGMELAAVNKIINSLKYASLEKTTFRNESSWNIFSLAIAEEEDCDDDSNNVPGRMVSALRRNPITSCLVGAALGLRDNAAGTVRTIKIVGSGLREFLSNPVQSSRAVWESTGNFWKELQNFKNIALRELDRFSEGYRSLSFNKKSEVICRVLYMLTVQYAVAGLSYGLSLPTLPATIQETLREIEKEFTGRKSVRVLRRNSQR